MSSTHHPKHPTAKSRQPRASKWQQERKTAQMFFQQIKNLNPQMTDAEIMTLLGIHRSDPNLLSRIRQGTRTLHPQEIYRVMARAQQQHGKKIQKKDVVFRGRAALGKNFLARSTVYQAMQQARVAPLVAAGQALWRAWRAYHDALHAVAADPGVSLLWHPPGNEGMLEEWRDIRSVSEVLAGLPRYADVDSTLVPLGVDWRALTRTPDQSAVAADNVGDDEEHDQCADAASPSGW